MTTEAGDRQEPRLRLVAMGNEAAGDDGAALAAAALLDPQFLVERGCELRLVGRIGAGLLDLLEPGVPVVLADTVSSGTRVGTVHELALSGLGRALQPAGNVSSHGFGPTEVLELARVLGRELPPGTFVGIEGQSFTVGAAMTAEVAAALPDMRSALERAIIQLTERAHA